MLAGLVLLIGTAACNGFLDSTAAVNDPNQPTTANRNTLLPGVAASIMTQQEGGPAMAVCEWMQQCGGVAGRFVEEYYKYGVTGSSFNLEFNSIYAAGGLISIRAIEDEATADNDPVYRGVAEVLEAMNMMWAADLWGDVPYSDFAAGKTNATYDKQMTVYASLQTLLDKAITDLAANSLGPSRFDIFYGGDQAKWTKLAHTLKARLALRTVEVQGVGQYNLALAQANLGINAANGSEDFNAIHTANTSERNMWAQFQISSFGNDLVAGARLVDLMKADNDPRLPQYFGQNSNTACTAPLCRYGGRDPLDRVKATDISPLKGSGRTNNVTFAQPLVTWEENQLIKAEAYVQLGQAGLAQPLLDAVRAKYGKASKPATLQSVMEEKYINLFQNIETWSDFRRTCYPRLTPAVSSFAAIPGRFLYGTTEKQTNKENVPAEGPRETGHNQNDPNPCPTT
jgi:hypothetical protein